MQLLPDSYSEGAGLSPAAVSRRLFLAGAISLSANALPQTKKLAVYDFATAEGELNMSVAFYDRCSSTKAFGFVSFLPYDVFLQILAR